MFLSSNAIKSLAGYFFDWFAESVTTSFSTFMFPPWFGDPSFSTGASILTPAGMSFYFAAGSFLMAALFAAPLRWLANRESISVAGNPGVFIDDDGFNCNAYNDFQSDLGLVLYDDNNSPTLLQNSQPPTTGNSIHNVRNLEEEAEAADKAAGVEKEPETTYLSPAPLPSSLFLSPTPLEDLASGVVVGATFVEDGGVGVALPEETNLEPTAAGEITTAGVPMSNRVVQLPQTSWTSNPPTPAEVNHHLDNNNICATQYL